MDHQAKSQRSRSVLVARSWLLLAASTALACSAAGGEPLGSSGEPIAGGTDDVSHQNVFLLASHTENYGALCTATLLAPNLLLTARHCVSPSNGDEHVLCGDSVLGEPYPASAFVTTNDPRPGDGSIVFKATDVRVPVATGDTCGYDVAMIILSDNVPSSVSVPAVPRIDREVMPGEPYTAVGYGVNESGHSDGSRRELEGLTIACEPGSCGEGVEASEFRGETGICSGDSGGPALDEAGKVVGVVSRGGPDCSTPVYSTVTAWHDFIIQTAQDAAALGNYDPPFWVTTGASDPPLLVGAGGAGGASGAPALAAEGDPCADSSECSAGLACYVGGTDSSAHCTATCKRSIDCSGALVCENAGDVSVCVASHHGADDSGGCSLTRGPKTSPLAALFAMFGAAMVMVRRRGLR